MNVERVQHVGRELLKVLNQDDNAHGVGPTSDLVQTMAMAGTLHAHLKFIANTDPVRAAELWETFKEMVRVEDAIGGAS